MQPIFAITQNLKLNLIKIKVNLKLNLIKFKVNLIKI